MHQKISDKIIKRVSLIQSLATYQVELVRHNHNLPKLTQTSLAICNALKHEGVFRTSLEALSWCSGTTLLDETKEIVSRMQQEPYQDNYVIHANSEQILAKPTIFLWGLEDSLLDLVENYLGVPVAYRGLLFQKDYADGQHTGTRLWHKDPEDHRLVKVLVYLNDVDDFGGPFEYIPRRFSSEPLTLKRKFFFSDAEMAKLVPTSNWVSCTGTAGTVIFFDPHHVFHRGKVPVKSDRFSLFYAYHSRRPIKIFRNHWKAPFSEDELLVLSDNLSERQRESIFWWKQDSQSFQPEVFGR